MTATGDRLRTGDAEPERRVAEPVASLTLEEKLARLVGRWTDAGSGFEVAPMQDAMLDEPVSFEEFARHGVGQITRFYGTAPVGAPHPVAVADPRWVTVDVRPADVLPAGSGPGGG